MKKKMATTKPNKHELKTKETRELLLRSAEEIFVRDGYERAELGEIAALAGRTKGAIYAHFKSKEDIFLALVEDKAQNYRSQMEQLLEGSTNTEHNLKIFRQFCLDMTQDSAWSLLFLEYKLFAIRHPESKEKLQKHFEHLFPPNHEDRLAGFLGPAAKGKDSLSRASVVRILMPLISALEVEAKFEPTVLDNQVLRKVVSRIFEALMF